MSRVLTIEDDETTANDIAVELRKRGFSVDWVNNGRGCKTCLPEERWPERRFACTAVDALSGEFVRWNNDSGVPLVRAIASSCAVPGIASPISINGRRYMDGGMRSATNADLAKGYEVVVVVAISSQAVPEVLRRPLERELQALRDSGSRVEIVNPDAESFQAFGPNLMDFGRRPAAAENGMRQGKAGLDTLRDLWISKV